MYPANYFEPLDFANDALAPLAVYVPAYIKDILYAEAVAADLSVSALLRKLLDEHLDLPEHA